jgi:hypothetical protein
MKYASPTEVICPFCKAEAGDPCKNSHTFHPERIEAARYALERTSRAPGPQKPARKPAAGS